MLIKIQCGLLQLLSSRKEFPSYNIIVRLLRDSEKGNKEAKKQLTTLRESMRTCEEDEKGDLSGWMEVIGSLNEHAEGVFTGYEDIIQEMTPAYVTALSIYRGSVIRTLRDTWSLSKKSEEEIKGNDILKSLDRIVARVTLHLTPELGAQRVPEPILGAWMMNYIWEYLVRTQVGIVEVKKR